MKKALIILVVIVVVVGGVLLVKARGKDDASTNTGHSSESAQPATETASTAQSGEVAVSITDFKFAPEKLIVKKGSTVTWTNQDDVEHNVDSDSDSEKRGLAGPLLSKGQTYSMTFTEVGTYSYHCRPHPYMVGSVQVVE